MPVQVKATLKIAKVEKTSDKVRTVTGWVTITRRDDGTPVIDDDDHLLPVQVLKRAVQTSGLGAGADKVGINHEAENRGSGGVTESFVFTNELKEKVNAENPAVPFFGPSLREGWMASLAITGPDAIRRVDSGELAELSLLGEATDYEEIEVDQ